MVICLRYSKTVKLTVHKLNMLVTIIISIVLVSSNGASERDIFPKNPESLYNDTCGYEDSGHQSYRCGDQCIQVYANCHCGLETLVEPYLKQQQCCIPSGEACTKEDFGQWYGDDGVCTEGRSLPMSSHCNNTDRSLQCYNSYQDSQYIGGLSHYTCQDTCVSVHEDMCRGVNWCGEDYEECGPQLRCSYDTLRLNLSSSLAPSHHYCVLPAVGGDGEHFRQGEYMVENVIKTRLI